MSNRILVLVVLALGFGASQAQAEATVFGGLSRARLIGDAGAPGLSDYLSIQASAGPSLRMGQVRPLVTVLGLAHLVRFGDSGPVLSAALGGHAVLGSVGPDEDLGFFGGLALDLPGLTGQKVVPSLAFGAGYSSGQSFGCSVPGWFASLQFGLRLYSGG